MESTYILPLILVSATLSKVGGRNVIECEEDHECGVNKFCYETGLCASCTNCTTYFRMPHEWKSCSKSPNYCGKCLSGYAADTLTDGSKRGLCTPIQQPDGSKSIPGDPGQWSNWFYGAMVIGFPLVALLVVLLIRRKAGAFRVNRAEEVIKTERPLPGSIYMQPPPYSSCGESPLLTRNTAYVGDSEYHCGSVWHTDHQMTSSSYHDNEPVKSCVTEKTVDGVQQATPFEYHPDELPETRPRTRSSCRPNDGIDHYDEGDDDEDGLSITHDNKINEVDLRNSRLSNDNDHMDVDLNYSEETAAAKPGDIMLQHRCTKCALNRKTGSSEHIFCRCVSDNSFRQNHSTYSLCSETDVGCKFHAPAQCSCEKNSVKSFFLPSKSDSGFISKCSMKFEELHDDTYTENTQTRGDKPSSTEGGSINITLPVNINILNTVNVCQ